MTVDEARAKRAKLIAAVRNGDGNWEPKSRDWSERFTDDEIWDAWLRVSRDPQLTSVPMMVAATLVGDVIDGRHR